MKTLVLGCGRSGSAALAALAARGDEADAVDGYELVIASPGVRVMSELEFGVRELKKRGVKCLAVTGSKGKSSVVKIVAEGLRLAGFTATPCGNYGRAVSDLVTDPAALAGATEGRCWAVVEVSSFQMETTNLPPDAFEAAVILNLQEDHLDRHGSVEVYHGLKRRLLACAKESAECGVQSAECGELIKGSYFDNAILRGNGEMAVWLMRAAGVKDEAIREAFARFEPLPHRMNLVGTFGGVRAIDDSKATSLAALAAGVTMASENNAAENGECVKNIRLIAGGLPKGDDPGSVETLLTERVKKVYLIGKCAESFYGAWKSTVDCEICGTMERAVEAAMREAERGDTVLLSPGTASFDQFKSFGERGDVFAALIKKEGQKR